MENKPVYNSLMKIKIYYEDTDAGGVVYYANYLKYFERARTEYLMERGVNVSTLAGEGVKFVIIRTEIDYCSPAVLGDMLRITTKADNIGGASFWVNYLVEREKDNKLIVEGKTKVACINGEYKLIRIPKEIINKLELKKN
jgi:acyl-CoA thioester hydrolase